MKYFVRLSAAGILGILFIFCLWAFAPIGAIFSDVPATANCDLVTQQSSKLFHLTHSESAALFLVGSALIVIAILCRKIFKK